MLTPQNKFIIVDDIDDHLNKLSKQFHDNGIGCRAFKYDAFYSEPLKDIKVAFFDININPSGGSSNPQIFNSLAAAIKQYIHVDNGPFALIFWTSNTSLIDDFKKFIQIRHSNNIPKPFLINCIDKDEFLTDTDSLLKSKLDKILNDEILQLLFEFEGNLSRASIMAIQQIYKIIPNQDKWGENEIFAKNFELIFSNIAVQTLGFEHAKQNPGRAVYEALSQIMNHQILKAEISSKWPSFLKSLKNAVIRKDISIPEGFKESELNAIFHIDKTILDKESRGIVINIVKHSKRFEKEFSKSYEEWVKYVIPFKSGFKESEKAVRLEQISKLLKSSKFVAIEISSACDYSQNKSRLHKYIYGIVVDKIDKKLIESPRESSMEVGTFFLDKKEFQIWVNFNFIFTASPNDKKLGTSLFLLKKEIVDMIGNRYANHGSRIGITSF
ncbi:hypothetical protein OQX63_20595 [Pedobacter sp. PF22-3]|uniref:hypothetical protein n=1 Tax=Pedobacter sp. PF22-3 TaxID=2994467 RepID=UPI002245BD83|nr:hypothetical protein [Pedobacter sp. PF22-3]MCX2495906.1 hypothetical protein [Pedobacter sp. PF22-3]